MKDRSSLRLPQGAHEPDPWMINSSACAINENAQEAMLEVYFPVFLHCTTATGTLLKSLFISRLNMSVSSSQLNFIREHLKNRCLQSAVHKVNMRH